MLELIFLKGLLVLAAAIPVSIAGISLTFFPLLALWILGAAWTFRRWPPAWGTIEKCFVIFLAVSLLSACVGIDLHHSLHHMWKKDFYFLVYALVFAVLRESRDAERLLRIFWVASLAAALLGILQFALGIATHLHPEGAVAHFLARGPAGWVKLLTLSNGRAAGPRSHPIRYSEGLLFALTMSIGFLGTAPRRERWKWVGGAWLLAAGILVSQTRGTWLALIVIIVLALIIERKRLNAAHGLLLVVPLIFLISTTGFRTRFASIWSRDLGSNTERLHMWHAGWEIFKRYPILGVGPGNVRTAAIPFEIGDERLDGGWAHLHNIYITFAAERGALGLAALLSLMAAFGVPLWKILGRPGVDPTLRAFCLAAFLGEIGFLLCGLTEMDYNNADVLVTFYFVMGVTLALVRASPSIGVPLDANAPRPLLFDS